MPRLPVHPHGRLASQVFYPERTTNFEHPSSSSLPLPFSPAVNFVYLFMAVSGGINLLSQSTSSLLKQAVLDSLKQAVLD